MTPERWQKIRPILESALELDAARRPEFLDRACADPSLRNEVESLISAHEHAGTDVLNPVSSLARTQDDETQFRLPPGKRIGAYEILEEIAVGGMGAVYRAVRADGQYKQQVALKIVRSELGSEFIAGRFKNERQILASLNHPNIAKILDGGSTAEGLPYLVMELVEGQSLDEYCDSHKLATTERLNLFLQICAAVQYAHQRLIIHRDIKPGNVLVNAEGVPKLLDFGIAKILESSEASGQPEPTISLVRLLTPEYASPEQIKGESITTASDVYSLGVVLYELLTGNAPYNVPTHTPHALSRAVCEIEPERPSVAVLRKPFPANEGRRRSADDSPLADTPEGSSEKLSKRLRGDLDNIVLMALRKEPQRRYSSVEQLAQDIRRHLDHLPVIARQDTFNYRTSKFISRHKVGVATAVLVTAALLSATGITLHQARIARAERAIAVLRFNDVRKLANSLIFEIHDSIGNLPGATPARKVLLERALEYLDSLAGESRGDSSLQRELATAYERIGQLQGSSLDANLGNTEAGLLSYQKAMAIWESLAKMNPANLNDQLNLAKGHRILSNMISSAGRPGAREQLEQALEITGRLMKSNSSAESLLRERFVELEWLAGYYDDAEDYAMAVGLSRNALGIAENLSKANPKDPSLRSGIAVNRVKIGNELAAAGSRQEALDMNQSGIELFELLAKDSSDAPNRRKLGVSLWFRGNILMVNGDTHQALESYLRSLSILEMLEKTDPQNALYHQDVAGATAGVGWAMERQGRQTEGVAMLNRAIRILEEIHDRNPTYTDVPYILGQIQIWKGEALAKVGNARDALDSYQKGLANLEISMNGSLSPKSKCQVAAAHAKVAQALAVMKNVDESLENYEKALQMTEPFATAKPSNVLALYVVADAYAGLGDIAYDHAGRTSVPTQKTRYWKEAGAWYEKSLGISQEIPQRGALSPEGFEIVDIAQVRDRLARSNVAMANLNSPSDVVMESQRVAKSSRPN